MHKMEKLMEKKKGKKLSDTEVKAKSSVLKDLSDTASDMMKDRLSGLKKVSVAAPSKSGLQEGLDLAKKLTEKMPEKSGMDEAKESEEEMVADAEDGKGMHMGDEAEESAEAEEEAGEESSKEDLLAEIERLKAKIEKMG
jgi:hypothetical protein